ncbi:biotin-independent malonate decarboxylase subunit gamma [Eubacteriales bacterium OttesenSCG-928-K08]|nr:biotin-independent malonate decarboxylase subunit gamma [Eubacteriales bacterium OttesenSCG-928-K08]
MAATSLVGKGRAAISLILDEGTFEENRIGGTVLDAGLGPGAVVGSGRLNGRVVTVIANDAKLRNPRFPVVYAGIIGLEEAYKMAEAVYASIAADDGLPPEKKRPLVLIVDSPGNGPGKIEEIFGMNKATGAYQLALIEARQKGHPVVAMIIGRAISGAFLCHGLQADRILTLSKEYGTMIHVMPLSSIARITKRDIETLETLSKTNPVFASGADYFYKLGGVEEIIEDSANMREAISRHIDEVYAFNSAGRREENGPRGRGALGAKRGGRKKRQQVLALMEQEFALIEDEYL